MNAANIEKVVTVLDDMRTANINIVERQHLSEKWKKESWMFVGEK